MVAVAVPPPAAIVPPDVFTVIVSVWFVPAAFVAVAGAIWMFASTQVFSAGLLLLPVPSVVRDSEPAPANGMLEVAVTFVVPAVADVLTSFPPRRSSDLG